jgi:hydroxyacylglutathione hydrolase
MIDRNGLSRRGAEGQYHGIPGNREIQSTSSGKGNVMTETRDFGPVQFIQGEKNGRYPFCNSIFLKEAGVVIDPSSDRRYLEHLVKQQSIASVWLTHWHEDHIMHLDLFHDIPLQMHRADEPPIADLENFIDWYGIQRDGHEQLIEGWKKLLTETFHYHPRNVDRYLEDGEIIDLAGLHVEVLHCPGHSPGHLAFFFLEPEILFLGDYDLSNFGPWYGDRYSNIDQTIASVQRLRQIPARTWLTGHVGGIFEEPPGDLWDQYLDVIQTREDKLLDFLKQPKTMEEIAMAWIVYGEPKKPVEDYFLMEMISMKKHAERLKKKGLVGFEDGRYQAL